MVLETINWHYDQFLVELPNVGHRTSVDPLIYDKPEAALTEFTSEVETSILSLEMMIGGEKGSQTDRQILEFPESVSLNAIVVYF